MFCPFGYPLRSLFSSSNRCKSALSASRRRANAHDTYPIEVLLAGESIMVHSDWQDRHVYRRSLEDEWTEEPWDKSQSANARKRWRCDVCRHRTHPLLECSSRRLRTSDGTRAPAGRIIFMRRESQAAVCGAILSAKNGRQEEGSGALFVLLHVFQACIFEHVRSSFVRQGLKEVCSPVCRQ